MKYYMMVFWMFISYLGTAQTPYEKGMERAFILWEEQKLDDAANLFERIATAEDKKWLPPYYVAQLYIIKSWKVVDKRNETVLKANLDKAQEFINELGARSPKNNYTTYLQAQLYTVWVAHDGMKYGMKYASRISNMYGELSKAAPENPIFLASKAEWDMGNARYFGTSIDPYCKELHKAIELFATFKPETKFHPKGSIEHARKTAKACTK